MTSDQRLDQLEPLVAENIAVLDRHTIQLTRLNNTVNHLVDKVNQLTEIATKQSDNISFLLAEHIKVQNRLAQLEVNVSPLKTDVAGLKEGQVRIESKLDLILGKLS